MQALFTGPRAWLRLPFARYWPASAALLLVVAIAAIAQFSLAPRHYTASQQLHIVVEASTETAAEADVQAEQTARNLSSPAFAASPQFAAATVGGLTLREREYNHVSASAVQTAMSLTHSGADVVLSATWTTPGVATEILSAATHALQTDSALLPTGSTGESIRLQTTTPPTAATRSPGEADAATQTLLQRLLLAALAALLLPVALEKLLTRRSRTLGAA